MTASITLDQDNLVYNDADQLPVYRSVNNVTASEGIPRELFVFKTLDETYSHIASVNDIEKYPAGLAAAQTAGDDYYRLADVTKEFSDLTRAQNFALLVRNRLLYLASDYPTVQDQFLGSATFVYTSEA